MPSEPEDVVRKYYLLVDQGRIADVLDLFTDDVVYERQGTALIKGKDELARFYGGGRSVAFGAHSLDEVLVGERWVAVRGNFKGTLKSGEDVDLDFTDWHHLTGDRIAHRQSLFPGRAI